MTNKKVTVCVPVYNGEKYIKQTLESILRQEYTALEILVIDNASTDNTLAKVEAINDGRITLIKKDENVGMVGNFNRCLKYCSGNYLQIVCADDYLEPDCIKRKVASLEEHPDCVMAISATSIANKDEKIIFTRKIAKSDQLLNGTKISKKSFLSHNLFGEPTNVLLRSDCVKRIGEFSEDLYYAVDWEYWLRACTCGNVYYISDPLTRFYLRNDSESSKLIKQFRRILNDDKALVNLCKNNTQLNYSDTQIIIHKINVKIRLLKKLIFSIIFN